MSIRNSDMEVLMSPLRESVDTTFDQTGYFLLVNLQNSTTNWNSRHVRDFLDSISFCSEDHSRSPKVNDWLL